MCLFKVLTNGHQLATAGKYAGGGSREARTRYCREFFVVGCDVLFVRRSPAETAIRCCVKQTNRHSINTNARDIAQCMYHVGRTIYYGTPECQHITREVKILHRLVIELIMLIVFSSSDLV